MKKLTILLFALLITVGASAQFHFGLKAGANLATNNAEGSKMLFGFNAGALAQYKFANFAVQPEVLFSMRGAAQDEGDAKFKTNYIDIPVMLQYYVIPGLAIEAGPQLGILLSAKVSGGGESEDFKEACNSIDFGLNFGASYELPVFPLGFFARYNLGFTGLMKDVDDSAKHRVIQFGLFYKF